MEALETPKTVIRIGADGKLKGGGSFEPGRLVQTVALLGGKVRETYVSGSQMSPKDIPIAKEIFDKYKGDLSNPKAQKEFFKRAKHWRNKLNQRLNKPQEETPVTETPNASSLPRRYQLAVCRLANGSFAQLNDLDLRDCSILGTLQPDARTFDNFKKIVEALESGT